tara:strand:+ start:1177 stop:1812 length:636 start_codon:yes stop_codon:yes gene_type:complete
MKTEDLCVIDNFLNKKNFEQLCQLKIDNIEDNIKVYHNRINKDNTVEINCIDRKLIEDLHKNYHDKAINILKKLYPKKLDLYDYSDFSLIVTHKNFTFPFHDDTPNKILSGVVYLYPEKNIGTIFSKDNKKGLNNKVIDWKQNRAVFFSRKERETWHTYKGDGKNNRVVLVYNLCTKRLRDVYKIEKKNYMWGNIRYVINPYLYRFFKFII